nr:reverse transcriptase domain-containing protein [Tanacetum cinerariifolium]
MLLATRRSSMRGMTMALSDQTRGRRVCGQTGHLQKDCKKNTAASTSGQADKKPGASDHVLCISTPMKDSVRITHVYRDLPLQFDDKIRVMNALPLDMYEFDIIL